MGTVADFESVRSAPGAAARPWRAPPALTLDEHGVIVDCNGSGEEFFGYTRSEFAGLHVSRVLPGLLGKKLFKDGEPNAYFNFLYYIGHTFEVTPGRGVPFSCGFSLVRPADAENTRVRLIVQSPPAVIV